MRPTWLILVTWCIASVLSADVDEKDVLVLTPENFDDAISKNANILVEFYAPWCGHCKQLTPHYAKAATVLKKELPEVALAKVDVDKHKELGTRFDVKGFPTLKWFSNGSPSEYNGGRTDDTIVSWIRKRLGPATKPLQSTADHDAFVASADVVVVGYFADTTAANAAWAKFENNARDIDAVAFGNADKADVHTHAGHTENSIVLHKKHDGGSKVVYPGTPALKEWIGINQLAYVTDFSQDASSKIFGSPVKTQVLLFAEKASSGYADLRGNFQTAAKEYYGQAVSVAVDPEHKSVLDYFGVTSDMLPCIFAVKLPTDGGRKGQQMIRYKGPTGKAELDADGAIGKFFGDVIEGKVSPHKKTEPVPAEVVDAHGVTTLVGTNFEEIVMDANKDVLVEFYAPWCGHCKQLAPIFDKLGESFKDIPSVVIAKMDATANDPPEGTDIQGFPTIKFYKAGATDKVPLDFEGDRTLKGFRKFIKKHASIPFELKKKGKKDKATKTEL